MAGKMTAPPASQPPAPPPPPAILIQCVEEPLKRVHMKDKSGIFKLTRAIEDDSVDSMSVLIDERGFDVNSKLSYGVSLLLKAIRSRSTNVAEYLISKGANLETSVHDLMKRPDGLEASYNYSCRYDSWCVSMLMKLLPSMSCASLQAMVDSEGRSLLHLACYFPTPTIFNYLLQRGLDPNRIDNRGASALTLLISHHDRDTSCQMAQSLLELPNCQVDIRNRAGSTPLFQSILINRLDIFFLLLQRGADPFLRTHSGNTLLHTPFLDLKRILMLYDLGLNVNAVNKGGHRPLHDMPIFDLKFFTLVLLGREVSEEEFSIMDEIEMRWQKVMSIIKRRVEKGEFSALRLQSLCRRTIRRRLFKINPKTIPESIWCLPIPRPLQLFLDVSLYAQYMLESLGNDDWPTTQQQ